MADLTTQPVSLYDTKKLRKKQKKLYRKNQNLANAINNVNRQNQTQLGNILNGLEHNAAQREARQEAVKNLQEIPRTGVSKDGRWSLVTRNGKQMFVPTEQLELQAQRATAKQGIVNNPTHYKGHVTVYDAKSGKYVSVTPAGAAEINKRNAALQEARQAASAVPQEIPRVGVSKDGRWSLVTRNGKHMFVPTEQLELQAQRAAAKQGIVNNPTLDKGHVTVYDAKSGKRVSATPAAAAEINKRNAELTQQATQNNQQAANKTKNTPKKDNSRQAQKLHELRQQRNAGNTPVQTPTLDKGHVTVYDAKSGKYVSTTPAAAAEINKRNATLAQQGVKAGKKAAKGGLLSRVGKFFGKVSKFFKGKGGKIGLAIAIGTGLIAAAIALFNKKKDGAVEEVAEDTVVTPTTPEDTTPEETTPTETQESSLQGIYTVVKGDCVWNIAKARLKEINGVDPTDAEIQKEVYRIMDKHKEANSENGTIKLQWEPDHYHVMIRPGDKLDLSA